MDSSTPNKSLVHALYANATLLGVIALFLLMRGGSWQSSAAAAPLVPQAIAGNGNLYLMPAQLLNNVWGCYVMDVENQTLTAYAYNGTQLRMIAARSIRYDHQLGNYNTHPDPEEMHKLVEIETQKNRTVNQLAPASTTQDVVKP